MRRYVCLFYTIIWGRSKDIPIYTKHHSTECYITDINNLVDLEVKRLGNPHAMQNNRRLNASLPNRKVKERIS